MYSTKSDDIEKNSTDYNRSFLNNCAVNFLSCGKRHPEDAFKRKKYILQQLMSFGWYLFHTGMR